MLPGGREARREILSEDNRGRPDFTCEITAGVEDPSKARGIPWAAEFPSPCPWGSAA